MITANLFIFVSFQTLFEAWHSGALSAAYMQKFLAKMQGEMSQLEIQELAPPGWRVIWNRYSGCLLTLQLITILSTRFLSAIETTMFSLKQY